MRKSTLREAIANKLAASEKFTNGEYTLYAEVPVSALKPASIPHREKTVIDEAQYANQKFDLLICKNNKAVFSITIGKYSSILSYLFAVHFRDLPHMYLELFEPISPEEQIEKAYAEVLTRFCEEAKNVPPTSYSLCPQKPVEDVLPNEAGIAKADIPRMLVEKGLMQQNGRLTVYGRKAHLFYRYDGGAIRAPTLVNAESGRVTLIGAMMWDGEINKSLEARLSHAKRALPGDEAFVDKLVEYLEELLNMPINEYFAVIGGTRERLDEIMGDRVFANIATYYDAIRLCHSLRNDCAMCTSSLDKKHLEALNRDILCELSRPLFNEFRKKVEKHEEQQGSESGAQNQSVPKYQRKTPELASASVRNQIKLPQGLPPCFMLSLLPISYYYRAASRRMKNGYANSIYNDVFGGIKDDKMLSGTMQVYLYHFAHVMPNNEFEDEDCLPYLLATLVDPICLPTDIKRTNKKNQ